MRDYSASRKIGRMGGGAVRMERRVKYLVGKGNEQRSSVYIHNCWRSESHMTQRLG